MSLSSKFWRIFGQNVGPLKNRGSAIDVGKSGTRKEELLVPPDALKKTYVLRRILNPMGVTDAIEFLLDKLRQTKSNSDFFDSMNT